MQVRRIFGTGSLGLAALLLVAGCATPQQDGVTQADVASLRAEIADLRAELGTVSQQARNAAAQSQASAREAEKAAADARAAAEKADRIYTKSLQK